MLKKLIQKLNRPAVNQSESVKRIRRSVFLQAALGLGAIAVAAVLIFAASTAWYTNVAKTDTLTFEAEAWGYDSELISLAGAPISIAPGKNGIVPLSVDNSAKTDDVNITVSVVKDKMSEDLQKRIYFYADTAAELNGEQLSRVYIGSSESDGYSYRILAGDSLTLSDAYYNDIPIRWEWVYDMQGYYFRGTVNGNSVNAEEYVRPIQYDLDTAVFEDEKVPEDDQSIIPRKLEKVNGMSVDEFLVDISSRDGYEGRIETSEAVTVGDSVYYKVDVDNDGYGIWAYLCNYGEILLEQGIDNRLAEDKAAAEATVRIAAKSVPSVVRAVQTENEILEAINDDSVNVVRLERDIALNDAISITDGISKTIDLGGNDLSYGGDTLNSNELISVTKDSKLTVMNGSLTRTGTNQPPNAINTIMSEVTLSNVTSTGFSSTVLISDNENKGETDSVVKIQNCNFESDYTTVLILGNSALTDAKTKLIVQNSTLTSAYNVTISGNASAGQWGTDIAVLDSTVSGAYGALYHPCPDSSALIANSTLSGYTAICVKGGTVTVCDSTVKGTGAFAPAKAAGGGFTDTGDAIYIEATYSWAANVVLKGTNTITSEHAYALDLFGATGKGPGKICVYDGKDSTYSGGDSVDGKAVCHSDIGILEVYNNELHDRLLPESSEGQQ